jgi:hypothetical protein
MNARTRLKLTLYVLCLYFSVCAYILGLMWREDHESCASIGVKLRVGLPLPDRSKETNYIQVKNQTTKCVMLVTKSNIKKVAHTTYTTTWINSNSLHKTGNIFKKFTSKSHVASLNNVVHSCKYSHARWELTYNAVPCSPHSCHLNLLSMFRTYSDMVLMVGFVLFPSTILIPNFHSDLL